MSSPGKTLPATRPETNEDLEPEFSIEDLLKELAEEIVTEPPPGAITVRMLMEKKKCTETVARSVLNRKVRAGKLQSDIIGNTRWYWRKRQ